MKISHVFLCAIAIALPTAAQANDNGWRVAVTGGATLYPDDSNPQFASLALTREYNRGYLTVDISTVRGAVTQSLVDAVPFDSDALTLSLGRSFGDVSFDGYASVGRRRFDPEIFERRGQRVTIDSKGSSFAVGGALSYDAFLTDSLILSPYLAIDYDVVDTARVITLPGGDVRTITSEEEGITGSFGAGMQKVFGSHAVGISAAFAATSNSTAARSGTGGATGGRIISALSAPGQSDEWFTFGALAAFELAKKLRLNLNASRSAGFKGPEATTLSVGLSLKF